MNHETTATSPVLSSAGMKRRAAMRDELIETMVRYRARRRVAGRLGVAMLVLALLGGGVEMSRRHMAGTASPQGGVAVESGRVESAEVKSAGVRARVVMVRSNSSSIFESTGEVPNLVKRLSDGELIDELRRRGIDAGLMEINGRVQLTNGDHPSIQDGKARGGTLEGTGRSGEPLAALPEGRVFALAL